MKGLRLVCPVGAISTCAGGNLSMVNCGPGKFVVRGSGSGGSGRGCAAQEVPDWAGGDVGPCSHSSCTREYSGSCLTVPHCTASCRTVLPSCPWAPLCCCPFDWKESCCVAPLGAWVKFMPGSHTCPVWWKEAGWTAPLPPELAHSCATSELPWSWEKCGLACCLGPGDSTYLMAALMAGCMGPRGCSWPREGL